MLKLVAREIANSLFICGEKCLFTLFEKSLFLVYYVDNSLVSVFNSHPVEGRDMLDTAGIQIEDDEQF